MTPLLPENLKVLRKISLHLLAAANEIDEFGVVDWGAVSDTLMQRQGVSLKKLRECCDEISRIENEERQRAKEWMEKKK